MLHVFSANSCSKENTNQVRDLTSFSKHFSTYVFVYKCRQFVSQAKAKVYGVLHVTWLMYICIM